MAANAATSASLPSPSSGTFLEISFRRLLKSCEEIMAGDNKGREDLTAWQSSPVFHHYVDTMQEQLADLETYTSRRRPEEGGQAATLRQRPAKASTAQLDDRLRERLATHDNLQESLTDELVGMAAAIRDSTRALEGRLAERGALLEDADDALQRSLENTRKSKARARQIYTRNKIGFCKTCVALLLVGGVFLGMYMFIRVTYFVGYKS